jgi:hypothetical protein
MPRTPDIAADAPVQLDRQRDYCVSVTFRAADPAGFCEVLIEEDLTDDEEYTTLVSVAIVNLMAYLQGFLNAQAEDRDSPSSIVLFPTRRDRWDQ